MATPPRRRASPPELPDELVEEILLRLPPDDPACNLRASVVCKTWSSTISHPSFRRRLHELHRVPPVLGVLHNWDNEHIPRFIPTTASSFEFSVAAPDYRSWQALDYRHGRALFLSKGQGTGELLLWEPITGAQQRVPLPAAFKSDFPTAAVFCAVDGCDHGDCLGGPFRVVFVFVVLLNPDEDAEEEYLMSAYVYSSETGTWGEPTLLPDQIANFTDFSSALVGNSLLYFMSDGEAIQEYDLARHSLTVFHAPDNSFALKFNLMLSENGELVVSEIESLNRRLKLWSRELSGGTGARWVLSRVIHLENLLPDGAFVDSVHVLGFAEGANAIFVSSVAGLFMIELQSDRVRKVCDDHGFCNLIPVVGFYTPHSRRKAHGDEHHDPPPPRNLTKEQALKLFDEGCKAMQEGNFASASHCFSHALETSRFLHYSRIAPQYASIFHRCGRALLCKALAATNPSGCVSKGAPIEEPVKITATTSKNVVGSSSASGCNVEHVPPSERCDSEEGENLNLKDKEDSNIDMTGNKDGSDLHLAWKMLDIARVIVVKSPEKTMEKANIFYALAEVSMKREDRDSASGYYLEALAILEHLFRPDDLRVLHLNIRICLVFALASKFGDAIPYCAKAISACHSLIQNLKNAKEALLANNDVSASAAIEDKISSLTGILAPLQEKLEELKQAIPNPSSGTDKIMKRVVSQTSHEQNVSNTVARASSLTSQMAGSDNSFHLRTTSTAATTGSTGSSVNDSGIVSGGITRANDELISAEPSPKRLAADDSLSVKCDSRLSS